MNSTGYIEATRLAVHSWLQDCEREHEHWLATPAFARKAPWYASTAAKVAADLKAAQDAAWAVDRHPFAGMPCEILDCGQPDCPTGWHVRALVVQA